MRRREFLKAFAYSASGLLLPVSAARAGNAKIIDVRLWTAPDHTRLVFELDGPVIAHKVFPLRAPNRLVVDLTGAQLVADLKKLPVPDPVVGKVRSGTPRPGVTRIVLDLKDDIRPRTFALKAAGDKGPRLVVDLLRKEALALEKDPAPIREPVKREEAVIVIDPGHGGEDPGAISPNGYREKNLTLAVAKKMERLINATPGFKCVLTRKGDYYVRLKKRVAIARRHDPDLFLSLHADAFSSSQARGASIYCLSERGKPSSDRAIRELVRRENEADLIGGADLTQIEDREVRNILMDLAQRESLNRALVLGTKLVKSVGDVTRLRYRGVKQAGFAVLKAPDIPSVLVEMAFLTNPEEERLLRQESHQKRLAKAFFTGAKKYIAAMPRV